MSILIATPMYGSMCHAEHFKSCLELKHALNVADIDHDWLVTTNESLITRARNTSAARFLSTSYSKLLFIDADIEFKPSDVAALWNMDVPIACGAYRMKADDAPLAVWVGLQLKAIAELPDQPFSVDFAGTGFLMIDREVLEDLKNRNPEWVHDEGHVGECCAWFQTPVVEHTDGTKYFQSEDYFFCAQAREAGYEIICDPSINLVHWGQRGY